MQTEESSPPQIPPQPETRNKTNLGSRFGMRIKIAGLVTLLVIAVGWFLPDHLFESARYIVCDHEIIDLRDEAQLRAFEIVARIENITDDVRALSRNAEWVKKAVAGNITTDELGLGGDPEELLQVEMATETTRIALVGKPPSDRGEEQRQKLLEQLRGQAVADEVMLSPIHYIMHGTDTRSKPVIWIGARTGLTPAAPVLLVLLDLEQILSTNRVDPRHLLFIADEVATTSDGTPDLRWVVHPNQRLALAGAPLNSDSVLGGSSELWKVLRETTPRATDDGAVQVLPKGLVKLPLRTPFYFAQGLPDARLSRLIERLVEKTGSSRQAAKDLRAFLLDFQQDIGGRTRIYLPQNAVSQVRVLATDRDSIQRAMDEFPARLAGYIEQVLETPDAATREPVKIGWGRPVRCESADAWMARFRLRGDATEHAYRLAYVGFREELDYSITEEFKNLRSNALVFGLVAGVISFLVGWWFVRPLDHITRTARSAADSAMLHEKMHQKINEVRESLPVKRRDEVGEIARALERLLRELLNGHERLRQAKQDLDQQVAEQTQELREKNRQLEQLARDKDAFLGNVSHELRQPLNALFGFTQLLEMSELDEEQRQDLAKIRKESQHLLDLINDILDYQKIIMEGLELEPEPIVLESFLTDMRDSAASAAARGNNQLYVESIGVPTVIRNDRKRLRQVLANLLGNACKFTRDGTVTLRAKGTRESGREWVVFEVIDTGRGMKPEELSRMFTKFAKLSAKEGNPGGTGLGLVISKGLCELMGGSIAVSSEFGRGSTFAVRLPIHVGGEQEEDTSAATPSVPATPPEAVPPRPGPRSVLVIDDDASVRELVARFLGANGYKVITAADGLTGLAAAKEHPPDVITLDAVMPGMDGWEVLSALKSDPATAPIPVVMVSFLEQQDRGYALGAADYVVKPIDWAHLASVIERHLDSHHDALILVVDDDATTREILRRTLEQRDWRVAEAEHGAAALEVLAAQPVAMILLDLMMPVMDGFDFIAEFRQHPEWHRIPVVVVTAKDPTADEKKLLEGSVVRILQKGSSAQDRLLAEIQAQVEECLHPPVPPSQP